MIELNVNKLITYVACDMGCLQSFCLEFLLFLLSCFSSDMVCLQRFFILVFSCSFLVI